MSRPLGTHVGVDVGGTHTDVIVIRDGKVSHGKALTTPGDLATGVLDGLEVVAEKLGISLQDLLSDCQHFVNGTTVVTNAVTQLKGRRVGALVTRGFRDTFRMARGPRLNIFDDHQQENPPQIVPWERLVEVTERIDYSGQVAAPLSDDEVLNAARTLVHDHEVEAIAICFLWSFVNGDHEQRAKSLIEAEFPDLYVVTSSEVHPLAREYERWNTAIFTCFVHDDVADYVTDLEARLSAAGLPENALSIFQCLGGSLSPAEATAQPLQLMDSGPVGGVIAARALSKELGLSHLICADMGGTSFDVALLADGEFTYTKRRPLGHPTLETGLVAVDIVSIGAGGGSIAWMDRRGLPQVGPQSAGSNPGPACYARGGERATVTDSMVHLNMIDAGGYLGGRWTLDKSLAERALVELTGENAGWEPRLAAVGIHDIAVGNMANAIREVSLNAGSDPREFTMLAYGGMTPMFACQVAADVGMRGVIVPAHSAAFSAWGVVMADRVRKYARTVSWNLDDLGEVDEVNRVKRDLVATARHDAEVSGLDADRLEFWHSGSFKFLGQVWELDLHVDSRPFDQADAEGLRKQFIDRYEAVYGEGTAWRGSPVILADYEILVTHSNDSGGFPGWEGGSADVTRARRRKVFEPMTRTEIDIDIYSDEEVGVGAHIAGPAVIDGLDTTVYVPGGFSCVRDRIGNLVLTPTSN